MNVLEWSPGVFWEDIGKLTYLEILMMYNYNVWEQKSILLQIFVIFFSSLVTKTQFFTISKGVTNNDPFNYTVGENIIATIKMRNNFCYPLKMVIFPILW